MLSRSSTQYVWRYDERGVYLVGGRDPLRTYGEPVTCRRIWELMAEPIRRASAKYGVPPALIVMTVATETAFARSDGFTGPKTFRWEPRVRVRDVAPARLGDYSAGPMQVLASTARRVIRVFGLPYDPVVTAPPYRERPATAPDRHPLYDYDVAIDIGAAVLHRLRPLTGSDPIRIAAAYNAGGLYPTSANPWGFRAHGDHLDRAAAWYGDACAVVAEQESHRP